MSEFGLIKHPGGFLIPDNELDRERINKHKNGSYLVGEIKKPRNPQYHRRFMKLLSFAFDYWEPPEQEINGIKSVKSFNKFRKDVTCMAGHCHVVVGLSGKATVEADSISFANMDDLEFHEVYKSVFNVLWEFVLSKVKGMTPEVVEETVNRMLSFD